MHSEEENKSLLFREFTWTIIFVGKVGEGVLLIPGLLIGLKLIFIRVLYNTINDLPEPFCQEKLKVDLSY